MTTMTRGPADAPAATPFTDARMALLVNAGAVVTPPMFTPNVLQGGSGNYQIFGAAAGGGGATAVAILDGLQAAIQLNVAPAGVGLIRYPSATPLGALIASPGSFQGGRKPPIQRIGWRVRRSAIGGNCGHNSGLILGWDNADTNGIPAAPLMRNGCFGIVGDSAGGWAIVAATGGVEILNQAITWPVPTNQYCDAEIRVLPPTSVAAAAVEFLVAGSRVLALTVGGPFLPPVVVAGGAFGINATIWHLVSGAVAPDLIIQSVYAGTIETP